MIDKFQNGETIAEYRENRVCEHCGKPCTSKDSKKYCSRACGFAVTGLAARQRQAARRRECVRCGALSGADARGRVRAGKYCGWACQRAAMKGRSLARKERHPKTCPHCNTSFIPKQRSSQFTKFCSRACAFAFERRNQFTDAPCCVCGKVSRRLTAQIKRSKRIVCSRECKRVINSGELHPMFRPGGYEDPKRRKQTGRWKRLAAEARKRDGHACRRCRRERRPDERRFPVDHILPWRVFENKDEADDLLNLATLCHECHSWKTNTVELKYFKGDMIGIQQYRKAINLP